jgi:uncharacterized protein
MTPRRFAVKAGDDETISRVAARRFVLGRQGLWPGRRWSGRDGAARALRTAECVQMDPLNVVARSHDLALAARVAGYCPDDLSAVMYTDRQFFDWGGNLRAYPMSELPFWRVTMRRKAQETRWADYAHQHGELLTELKAELRARGPLGNRDFTGRRRVVSYRGGKDSAVGLYYLWLVGEVMVHHRVGFERVYDLSERICPAATDRTAMADEAEAFFARKAISYLGWCNARSWTQAMKLFAGRTIAPAEARRRLDDLVAAGEVRQITIEGEKQPCCLPAADAPALAVVQEGGVPDEWRPLGRATRDEVVFLAPLDTVIARGRAKALFDFDYLWEVYKPAAQRRWGYYTLPILYGDRLVARIDPRLERAAETLVIKGFWLDDERLGRDGDFANALARGLGHLAEFVKAAHVDAAAIEPARLRRHIEAYLIRPGLGRS